MRSQEQAGLVLIVEDNRNISEMVGEYLEGRGFEVDYASDGMDGYRLAAENNYDVIVLDLMLPGLDGIEVCKRLRTEARKSTPVLMLTARDTLDEKLTGLSSGADDYLTKPFGIRELLARVRAMLRRPRHGSAAVPDIAPPQRFGDMLIDHGRREVTLAGSVLPLTTLEFALLTTLAAHPGLVFTRAQLLERVWDTDYFGDDHVVDVHIANLRKKLGEDPAAPHYIETVRGAGYRFAGKAS